MATPEEASAALKAAASDLASLADRVRSGQATRDDFGPVLAAMMRVQRDQFGRRPRARKGEGGGPKILAYLQARVGQEVFGEELSAISGIHEWARRVRELRVERGYAIAEVGESTYRLESTEPDWDRAKHWQTLNDLRKMKGSAEKRLERLFLAFPGEVLTAEDLRYVGKVPSTDRRVRALREKLGLPINTNIDEPDTLGQSEYRLVSAAPEDRLDTAQRLYPPALREAIFKRDNYTCQVCGRNREAALAGNDTRFYIEMHHKVALADELATMSQAERDNPDNLITLCHEDHLRETAKLQKRRRLSRGG